MHAFDILGDPVRRRILEILAEDRHASGEIVAIVGQEFGITRRLWQAPEFARARLELGGS